MKSSRINAPAIPFPCGFAASCGCHIRYRRPCVRPPGAASGHWRGVRRTGRACGSWDGLDGESSWPLDSPDHLPSSTLARISAIRMRIAAASYPHSLLPPTAASMSSNSLARHSSVAMASSRVIREMPAYGPPSSPAAQGCDRSRTAHAWRSRSRRASIACRPFGRGGPIRRVPCSGLIFRIRSPSVRPTFCDILRWLRRLVPEIMNGLNDACYGGHRISKHKKGDYFLGLLFELNDIKHHKADDVDANDQINQHDHSGCREKPDRYLAHAFFPLGCMENGERGASLDGRFGVE